MSSIERPEGLPSSWTIEFKGSDEEKRECYIDPETGREFHSMLEVSEYLNTLNTSKPTEKTEDNPPSETTTPEKSKPADVAEDISENKQESSEKSSDKKAVSGTQVEGLPPGWIKEVVIRRAKGKTRKDPYYLDPSSDYAFLSKLDVLRYLESGDIEKCAIKPRKKSDILIKSTNTPTMTTSSVKNSAKRKSKKSTATQASKKLKISETVETEKDKNEGTEEEVKDKEPEVEKSTNDEKTEVPLIPEPSFVDTEGKNVNGDIPNEVPEIPVKESKNDDVIMT